MRHIIPVSGKDSLWTAIVQTRRAPDLPYELMFNPTGAETPEVDEWLNKASAFLGLPIHRVGGDLEEIIGEQGILPSMRARYCTRLAKIYPMEDWIGDDPAIVYYGIRADENRTGYIQNKKTNIVPAYPLVEEGHGISEVYGGLDTLGLLPPQFFWQSLYDMVKAKLGEYAPILDTLSPVERSQLFSWRTRMNCYFGVFQRSYEGVGLLEHHPQLFWRAAEIEETTGATGYTWQQGRSLRDVAANAATIKERRANRVAAMLLKSSQLPLFEDEHETPDLLSVVSCGLFCGK